MGLTPPPHLMPKVLENSRAIPLLTIRACVAYKKSENLPNLYALLTRPLTLPGNYLCAVAFLFFFFNNGFKRGVQFLLSVLGHMAENLCMCSCIRGDEPSAEVISLLAEDLHISGSRRNLFHEISLYVCGGWGGGGGEILFFPVTKHHLLTIQKLTFEFSRVYRHSDKVIILSDNCQFSLIISSFLVLLQPTGPTYHKVG